MNKSNSHPFIFPSNNGKPFNPDHCCFAVIGFPSGHIDRLRQSLRIGREQVGEGWLCR
jgi:hypothetical protein